METFITNITSFPTAIYTVLLMVCVGLIFISFLGVLDLDGMDIDLDTDADMDLNVDLEIDVDASPESTSNVLTSLLVKYKLVGVPITFTFTILILIGWLISYYIVHFFVPFESGTLMRYLVGLPIFLGSLYLSARITGVVISPLRKVFQKASRQSEKIIIGQPATVRSASVDNKYGEAVLDDGGAGLILKVRSTGDEIFTTGDRVIIYEKIDSDNNIYRVISEEDFLLKMDA